MASTLAQRMTARERAFALVALIAVGTISTTLEPKPVQPPFAITRGERYEGRWTRVGVLPSALQGTPRRLLGWTVELCMIAISLFMLHWGAKLVRTTWFQAIADFPIVSTGMSYLPVPVGGAIVGLFVIERLWTGRFFEQPEEGAVSSVSAE